VRLFLSSDFDKHSALQDEAFDWIVRLNDGEPSPDLRRTFEAWRRTSAAHKKAATDAEALWADMGRTESAALHRLERARAAGRSPRPHGSLALSRRHFLAGGLAASAAVVIGGASFRGLLGAHADFETATGERRSVNLAGGSNLWLNTDTALSVDGERRATLHRGEAFFEIARDAGRPFVVGIDTCTVSTASAVFGLRCLEADGIAARIVVASGEVRVKASGGRSAVVGPDEALIAPEGEGSFHVSTADAGAEFAWQRGKLIFNRRPFGAVVDEVARFLPERIVVLSDDLRHLEVTGVFDLDRPEELLPAMELILPIRVTRLPFVTLIS